MKMSESQEHSVLSLINNERKMLIFNVNDIVPFKRRKKTDNTVAQRMRLYRQRKREKREQAGYERSKPLTSCERMRLHRQRKKQAKGNALCVTSLFENLKPSINPSISVNTVVMNESTIIATTSRQLQNEYAAGNNQTSHVDGTRTNLLQESNEIPDKNESFTAMSRQSEINDDIQAVNPTPSRSSQQIHQRSIFPELAENQIQETNSLLKYAVVKNNEVKEDECDLYAKILAEKLRKIPEFERDLLMHDINGMVIRTIHRSRLPASAASYSSNQPSNFSLSSSLLSRPSSAETGFDENTQDQMDHRTRNCEAISQAILKTSEVLHIPPEQSEILFRWKL